MQRQLSTQIRGFIMRTVLIGSMALASAVSLMSACGGNDKNKNKASAPQSAVDQAQKVKVMVTSETRPLEPAALSAQPDPAAKPVRHTLVLGEGKGGFRLNGVTLSDDAKAKIDELFTSGAVDLKDAHFEIEGHTDNLGSPHVNEKIGFARAEAVRMYICERYEVPLDCISVISYGLEKPFADNSTPEGRAQNRRVVIKVVD